MATQVMALADFTDLSKTYLGFFILACYIIGAYCSVKIVKYFKKLNFKERPINVLILANEIIYFSIMTFTMVNILIVLIAHETPVQFFSEVFGMELEQMFYCRTFFYLSSFNNINMSASSFGIAFIRLLYVRAPNLVNVTLGSKCLLQLVGLGQLLIACGSTHWFVEGDARSRAAMNLCLSPDILAQMNGNVPETTTGMRVVPVIGVAFRVAEVLLYASIYQKISNHDKTMMSTLVISQDVYKQRQNKNSFTLMSQMIFFWAENLFLLHHVALNLLGLASEDSREIRLILRIFQFAFLGILKIMTVKDLRQTIIPF